MKIDTIMFNPDLAMVPWQVSNDEEDGYDGFWSTGTGHDPFLPLTLAAEHSAKIKAGTTIAVAFPRNLISIACITHDLQSWVWPVHPWTAGIPPNQATHREAVLDAVVGPSARCIRE